MTKDEKAICCLGAEHKCLLNVNDGYCLAESCQYRVFEREAKQLATKERETAYTEKQVLKSVYKSGLHQYNPKVLSVSWKDGIGINEPSASLMNFVRKLTQPQGGIA